MLSFTLRPLYPGGISHVTHWTGRWAGSRVGPHSREETNVWPLRGSEPRLVGRCPSSSHITGRATVIATNYIRIRSALPTNYYSSELIRVGWAGHVARMGNTIGAYRVLEGKPEGKEPSGRPKRRWEYNIKIIIKKWGVKAWTGLIWLRIGTGGGLLWMR